MAARPDAGALKQAARNRSLLGSMFLDRHVEVFFTSRQGERVPTWTLDQQANSLQALSSRQISKFSGSLAEMSHWYFSARNHKPFTLLPAGSICCSYTRWQGLEPR